MKKRQWRELMKLDEGNESFSGEQALHMISNFFSEEYLRKNTQINKGDKYWYIDQTMVSVLIDW